MNSLSTWRGCCDKISRAAERRWRGTPKGSRALTCFRQAVTVPRWFRGETDIPELGRDHKISRATAYRYIDEAVEVLAAQAPDLHQALTRARSAGHAYLIMDRTPLPADRCAQQVTGVKGEQIDLWYSGKARHHAGNIQGLSAPNGLPLWVCDVEPGSVHDLTAARTHLLGALYAAAADGLPTLADGGYDGTGIGVLTPIKQPAHGQILSPDNRTCNQLLRGLRCLGERGFALLKGRWRTLRHITAGPSKIGDITRAASSSPTSSGPDVVLRSQSPAMVCQEIYALLCVYQAIRHLMGRAGDGSAGRLWRDIRPSPAGRPRRAPHAP